ncbi:hypothetical protein AVEN_101638-1 [Araneus ventricosus]|uniref:Uncharacterized protein n=1 Tax=Araneus ventricosus TaxID=182803 RepID=A0A4Y2EVP5_ARAVE|nr:hypothetical protein AVEN_101638-1 [Araneus ventricosus]
MLTGSRTDVKSDVGRTTYRWCGAKAWRGRGRPRYLTAVQKDEVRPKIALELLLNEDVNVTKLNSFIPRRLFSSRPFKTGFGMMRHELDSPNLGGHLPHSLL